jgi:DNA-binding transcriptional LysR family regulator
MLQVTIDTNDDRWMETRQLEYFVAVAEELNFTRAAARLFAVQSTVSAGIRALESDLGVILFDRSTKRISLTPAAERLLPEARATIAALERLRGASAEVGAGLRGRLRVGIFTNSFYVDLPELFGDFHHRYPLVDLQLIASPSGSTGLADDVRRGRVDLTFTGLPASELGDFDILPILSTRYVAVLPEGHPLAGKTSLALRDVAAQRFVDSPRGYGNRVTIERVFAAAGLTRHVATEVNDLGEIPSFVRAGLGVAIVPDTTIRPLPGVVMVPIAPAVAWEIAAIHRRSPSPAVVALRQLLAERVAAR